MKRSIWLTVLCLTAPVAVLAQGSTANPVVSAAREIYDRQSKYIVAAAEQMPEDKFSFHPTPEQWTFGKIVAHVAQGDFAVCSMLSDTPAPPDVKSLMPTDPKDKLVSAVQASFDFCGQALSNLQDSKLGDNIKFFGGRPATRARALFELTNDLEDHYSQMASYLRLNGMLPPSSKPKR
jgi:uncharacterized damage-inducible protein DinB